MPLITEDRLLELATANPRMLYNLPMVNAGGARNLVDRLIAAGQGIDMDGIRAVLAAIRYEFTDRRQQQAKGQRPWDVDPQLYKKLDRKQPWWGWEFELGYKDAEAYKEGVGYAYDNFTGATFDSEGEGRYPVEITFPPQEMSTYLDGTAQAARFITWNAENSKRLCYNGGNNNVGSHLNMSDPRFINAGVTGCVANFLNRTLQHCRRKNGERQEMFGRESIYAGFFLQQAGGNHWMEFKGFRTTYDVNEWARYIKTAAALQKCIDAYFELAKAGPVGRTLGVKNLYDVAFADAIPEVGSYENRVVAPGAARLSTRGGERDADGVGAAYLLY